jgi:acetolactate decarboxylase
MKIIYFFILQILALSMSKTYAQGYGNSTIYIAGAMKNVMWKGELQGSISLDSFKNKPHSYGIGPLEYLKGELLLIDGKVYQSFVRNKKKMHVIESHQAKAPFFVYTHTSQWRETRLPDSIKTLNQLEKYLISYHKQDQPFVFKLKTRIATARIHIVNLPEGTKVSSPDDAHEGQVNFTLKNTEADLIGFFSKNHQGIFTHHDTYMHIHLITKDRKAMGHLDNVMLGKGTVLYLPAE